MLGIFSIIVFNNEDINIFSEMVLDKVHILPTDKTPEVHLNPEGIITVKGRGISDSKTEVTEQITNWIDEYLRHPAEKTFVTVEFEYLNSFSTAILVSMLKKFLEVKQQSKKLIILWYYENGDDDIFERGEYIASVINFPIEFIMVQKHNGI